VLHGRLGRFWIVPKAGGMGALRGGFNIDYFAFDVKETSSTHPRVAGALLNGQG